MELAKIIGLSVTAIKGIPLTDKRRKPEYEPVYILFSDQKTILELEEQDYMTFHACAASASHLTIREDSTFWKNIFENNPDANISL